MKRVVTVLIFLILLLGCQKEITSFDEVIDNNQVELDGVKYEIQSVDETTYEYDDDKMIRSSSTHDNHEQYTDFKYENNLLIEENRYSENMNSTVSYYYDEKERKKQIIYQYEHGNFVNEFEYDDNYRKIIFKDQDGVIVRYNEGFADENNNILSYIIYDSEGNKTASVGNTYKDSKLITTIGEDSEGKKVTSYYKYNNLDDKIFSYTIHHGEEPLMIVEFFEYKYNNDDLPIMMRRYRVQSVVSQEVIRDYWER